MNTALRISFCWLAAFCAAISFVLPAGAAVSDEKTFHLPAVTVTAQKTEQDAQDVPGTVEVFTAQELSDRNITKLHDLIEHIPNVNLKKNSVENVISIRGISSFGTSLFSTTGFYVDGVNYPIHQMQNIDFLDVERIEVLKGPQGTLYGRNSQAGVINIITKQPGNNLEGAIFTEAGFWAANGGKPLFKEGFRLNVPVVEDVLAIRLSGQHEYTDGWMKDKHKNNDALRNRHLDGRMTTLWTPTDDLDVSLILEGGTKRDGAATYRLINGPDATSRNKMAWDGTNYNDVDMNSQVVKVEYRGSNVVISSITGRQDYSQRVAQDMDMTPWDMTLWGMPSETRSKYSVEVISEELRIASKQEKGNLFDWLVGVYGYSEDIDVKGDYSTYVVKSKQDNWGAALFAQGTLHLFDRLHLTAGGRFDHTRLDGKKNVNPYAVNIKDDLSYTEFLPSFSIAFDVTDTTMAYVKAAKGYLAGGFDNYFAMTKDDYTYDPEYSWTYELGLKSKLFDDRLSVNLAGFYIDTRDKQVAEWRANPRDRYIRNAAKVRAHGVELETVYMPLPNFTLHGAVGYLNSEIKDWEIHGPAGFDYHGKKTPGSPEWSYSGGAKYRWDFGLFVGADVVGVSSYYTDTENKNKVDGRAIVNAQIGYEMEALDITFWVKNLFDKDYRENKWNWGTGDLVQQGEPLSCGLRLTYRF